MRANPLMSSRLAFCLSVRGLHPRPEGRRPPGLTLALALLMTLAGVTAAMPTNAADLSPLERLGEQLFHDASLSNPPGVACASCHNPAQAFQGNNGSAVPALARGAPHGALGRRNTPSIMYASFTPPFSFVAERDEATGKTEHIPVGGQFLDGRAGDLVEQFAMPLLDPHEMNAGSKDAVVVAVRKGSYAGLVREVYGDAVFDDPAQAFVKLAQATAAFEGSARFHPFASRFDDYLRGTAALSEQEARGFELFKDPEKGNCLACHVGKVDSRTPADWLFTDYTYDALGGPKNPQIVARPGEEARADLGLCEQTGLAARAPAGVDPSTLCGAFKVPSLRNVAVTGPWLHNGALTKLRDVVAFYATRDVDPARWYPVAAGGVQKFDDLPAAYHANVNTTEIPYDRRPGQTARLDEDEIDAITAFLETLTDRTAP